MNSNEKTLPEEVEYYHQVFDRIDQPEAIHQPYHNERLYGGIGPFATGLLGGLVVGALVDGPPWGYPYYGGYPYFGGYPPYRPPYYGYPPYYYRR